MLKKLQTKLLIMNMVITSLVILGAFAVVFFMTYSNIKAENEEKVNSMTRASTTVYTEKSDDEILLPSPPSTSSSQEYSISNSNRSDEDTPSFIMLLNEAGRITNIETYIDLPQEVYTQAAVLAAKDASNVKVDFFERQWIYSTSPYTVTVISHDGQITEVSDGSYRVSFLDITETQNTLKRLFLTFAVVWVAVIFVVFFISYYFARRSIKPISEAWERQNQFIVDASHELKTPLSVITANYDALLANENETIKSQREWLDYMKLGTDRMAKLINSLLSLAKIENKGMQLFMSDFNMCEAINEIIRSMDTIIQHKNVSLHSFIEPDIIVFNDKELTVQVFTILFENAIKYTDFGGRIDVSLSKQKNHAVCKVRNSGKGISQQDITRIFDRFYRTDPSRTEENGGYGLGLPIAKTAIERLGGSISATSIENDMTTFTFDIGEVK